MSDIATLVEDARAPGTFSVLDAAKGRSYPQDIVSVYTDHSAAYEAHKLEKRINDEQDNDVLETLVAEQAEFRKGVKNSVLTFRLRGVSPGMVKRLAKQAKIKFPDDENINDRNEWGNFSYLAAHIVDVTDAEGNVDNHRWSTEDIFTLQDELPEESFDKLNALMLDLTFAAAYFEESVTADFLLA